MKALICLLCVFFAGHAVGETLSFVAKIEDETLAEEAILLAHCLAERTGQNWEYQSEAMGSHWLKVAETKGELSATYSKGKKETTLTLKTGGAEEACSKLEPKLAEIPISALAPLPDRGVLSSNINDEETDSHKPRTWLWVGVGAGALAMAGFFIWKSHQPDHHSIVMAP